MKNSSIQGLRGIAAMIVFFSHALLIPELYLNDMKQSPLHIFFDGQISVMVFIALSGFFYYNKNISNLSDYVSFIKKKAIRIYIPYFLITVLAFILLRIYATIPYNESYFTEWGNSFWKINVSFLELLKQCSILWPHNADLINPPSWYLSIEVRLFLLIPLLLFLLNKHKIIARITMMVFIILMCFGIFKYIGACLCGYFAHSFGDYLISKRPQFVKNTYLKITLLLISLLFLNINNEFIIPLQVSYVLQAIGAAMIVAVAYRFKSKLLSNRFVVWLGNISYEFYLVHFVVLLSLRPYYHCGICYIIISLFITLFISYIIQKLSTIITKFVEFSFNKNNINIFSR